MFCNIFNKLRKIYTGTSAIISKEIQPHSLNFDLQSIYKFNILITMNT